jgi:hypothetical protein
VQQRHDGRRLPLSAALAAMTASDLPDSLRRHAPGPWFVSTRADGLCMRLATLLDVMLLARWFDGRFGFFWDVASVPAADQQTFEVPERVFSRDFLDRHRLPETAHDPAAPDLSTRAPTPEAFSQILDRARLGGPLYFHQPRQLPAYMPFLADRFRPADYAETFAAIGFTAAGRHAIDLARRWPLAPGAVAIHLRGGDILHGTHAHMATYLHKAPSILEVEALLVALQAEGRPTWLVGQEPDVQACLSRLHPGVHAVGVTCPGPELDPVARVLFDATLMSRMARIHGGPSGVTLLSRRLGGGLPFVDLARKPPGPGIETLLADPLSDPRYAGVSPAAKAHAYVKPVAVADPAGWSARELDLIGLARRHRPDSKFLALLEVAVLSRLGRADAAESRCRALLTSPLAADLDPELAFAFLLGADHYFPVQSTAPLTAATTPCCALFGRLNELVVQPGEAARTAARQALQAAEAALAPDPIDPVFRRMIERCMAGL